MLHENEIFMLGPIEVEGKSPRVDNEVLNRRDREMENMMETIKLLIAGALLGLFLSGCADSPPQRLPAEAGSTMGGACELVVRFNGRATDQQFFVACPDPATVLTILEKAERAQQIEFSVSGSGDTAFITSIGGVENEKGAGDNWIYQVNGKLGDKSSGVFGVQPGDVIQWSFGKYRPSE